MGQKSSIVGGFALVGVVLGAAVYREATLDVKESSPTLVCATGSSDVIPINHQPSRFEQIESGDWLLVDFYSDHSGIYEMRVVTALAPEKIVVEHGGMKIIGMKQVLKNKTKEKM